MFSGTIFFKIFSRSIMLLKSPSIIRKIWSSDFIVCALYSLDSSTQNKCFVFVFQAAPKTKKFLSQLAENNCNLEKKNKFQNSCSRKKFIKFLYHKWKLIFRKLLRNSSFFRNQNLTEISASGVRAPAVGVQSPMRLDSRSLIWGLSLLMFVNAYDWLFCCLTFALIFRDGVCAFVLLCQLGFFSKNFSLHSE